MKSEYRGWEAQKFIDDSIAWANNPLYGWCEKNVKADGTKYNIYTDGLKIYTTLDAQMQRYAEEAVENIWAGIYNLASSPRKRTELCTVLPKHNSGRAGVNLG